MKPIVFLIILFLSGCSTNLQLENESKDWIVSNFNQQDVIILENTNDFKDGFAAFDFGGILYNGDVTASDCFGKKKYRRMKIIYLFSMRFFKKNITKEANYEFDYKNVYFLKNGKKYPVTIFDWSNVLKRKNINILNITSMMPKTCADTLAFESPLICGELEDALLVFNGLRIDGKKTSPIKLRFSFKNPTEIPLYQPVSN